MTENRWLEGLLTANAEATISHGVCPKHDLYFNPVHEEFQARTMWSLSNAFTSAFKELEPIPQYNATAKLAGFLHPVRPS
jgi:hypothetical protein